MTRPRLLDLFCGAGGAAMGYHRAGFDVVGVDNRPQPRYPFEFHRGDAMTWPLAGFDAIHASPPCQAYATTANSRKLARHPDLLAPVRARLLASGRPYVIENVANAPMSPENFLLCGVTFGLPIARHRRFEMSPHPGLVPNLCSARRYGRTTSHGPAVYAYGHGNWRKAWADLVVPQVWPWMTPEQAGQAIPPAYTQYLGGLLLAELGVTA